MSFRKIIAEKLSDTLDEGELSLLPRGFQTLGKVIILKLNPKLLNKKDIIAQAYLDLLPKMRAAYQNTGRIVGTYREPENIEFIMGKDDPIVEHKEHGIIYRFDITKIMFSKGNINERKHLATLVKNGEIIVDMFAGIGYFSLPIAKHSGVERIYSIELNPESYKFFVENIKLNHLEKRIFPINGDCKIEVVKLSESGVKADRVIMGVFPAPSDYIKEALTLVKDKGTMFHYEGVVEKDNFNLLFDEFKEITLKEGYKCELNSHRIVKSYGPHLYHIVLDILVFKI